MTSSEPGRDTGRLRGDAGAGLVEYGLLVALILVVSLSAVQYFQTNTQQSISKSSSAITHAGR